MIRYMLIPAVVLGTFQWLAKFFCVKTKTVMLWIALWWTGEMNPHSILTQPSSGQNGVMIKVWSVKIREKFKSSEMHTTTCDKYQQRCCTQCFTGQRLDNNVCVDCPAGYECKDPILLKKKKYKCLAGTYSGNRDIACKRCEMGKSCTRDGMANEENCPNGKNCNNPAFQLPCDAGMKCYGGTVEECGRGKWSRAGKTATSYVVMRAQSYIWIRVCFRNTLSDAHVRTTVINISSFRRIWM